MLVPLNLTVNIAIVINIFAKGDVQYEVFK